MKRIKKGFTLIELLAVIIVLAIVAVIAVPIVLDVIQESKDSANKTTAYNIIDAAKLYYTESAFDEEKANNINNKNNIYKSITMSNEIPESGELYVNESGKIALSVVLDNKCYIKYFESELQIYDENDEKCNAYVSNDEIIPEVSFEIIGTLGENGWYKANSDGTDSLYVKIKVTDEGSGISYFNWCEGTACTPANKETILEKSISIQDTPNTQVCVEAYDNQGNTSGVVCSEEIKKDTQAPEFSGIQDITIPVNQVINLKENIEATDVMSGLASEYTITPESIETNQTGEKEVIYEAKDNSGNIRKVTRKIIISSEAPTITFKAEDGAINENGWAKSDFYVTINVKDNSGHGIKSFNVCTATTDTCEPSTGSTITDKTSATREIVNESNNNRICVQATDNYNQTSSVICSDAYKLDKTNPTAGTILVNGSSEIKEWYTGNVTIEAVDGSDGLSGHLNTTVSPLSITSNTDGTTVTVTTTDKAGKVATREYTIKVDKTKPSVTIEKSVSNNQNVLTATITPTTTTSNYTYEWYKDDVVISGATNSSYTTTEAGTYKVVVTTGAGLSNTSNEITIDSYSITYNVNDGTGTIASTTKVEDISTNITNSVPTRSGYEFMGWGTTANDTTVDYATNAPYTSNSGINLFAIWRKTVTITFYKNGAASITPSGGSATTANSITQTCYMYNAEANCSITSPAISASTNTPTVLGWGTSTDATSSVWTVNTAKTFSSDASYYAVTKKDAVTYTATFNRNNATLTGSTNPSCTIAATYNGTAQTGSCQVKAPTISRSGYTVIGFNTSSSATTAQVASGATFSISSNPTYYAITKAACSYAAGQTWTYNYTGGTQSFTVPCSGTYKLEVWGAQGGMTKDLDGTVYINGGQGGYSYGNKSLSTGTILYLGIGGQGGTAIQSWNLSTSSAKSVSGGYNGGGKGTAYWQNNYYQSLGGGGGGATHIATATGTLASLSSNKNSVLIVAGGGGGGASSHYQTSQSNMSTISGGVGGGTSGGAGSATGGTQSSGYTFGQGQDGYQTYTSYAFLGSGAGGGYYGGTAKQSTGLYAGGGGSGYIGGVNGGSMSNGQRSGNGYARITLVSID